MTRVIIAALDIAARQYSIWLILVLFFIPIVCGMLWSMLPAFGYFPVLGFRSIDLTPWRDLLALPGLSRSILLTLFTGVSASFISAVLAIVITASFYTSNIYKSLQNTLAPLLAIPHITIAAGLAFLLAPSGFIFRIIGNILGWDSPPNLIIVPDKYGLVLILSLCLKEVPFFLFIINSALAQINASNYMTLARSMGYHPYVAWFKVILPQVYSRMKLPLVIVIIFSMSVVDIAIFTAPNNPPPLAVLLLDLFYDPDLSLRLVAAAGGLLLVLIIMSVLFLWYLLEIIISPIWRKRVILTGNRGHNTYITKYLSYLFLVFVSIFAFGALLAMLVWSFSLAWRFPAILPTRMGLDNWLECSQCDDIISSFSIAMLVTFISIVIVVIFLERTKKQDIQPLWFYIPLLIPQVSFLFGFDIMLISMDMKGFVGVVWAHWIYVLPYIFLILYIPYRKFDERYEQISYSLGQSRIRTMLMIKLPILFRPIIYAFAIGFAVSISEYLPTLIAGGGRVNTLATEMVALASSGDRRLIGTTSVFLAILPCAVFILAIVLPNLQSRQRRGLQT